MTRPFSKTLKQYAQERVSEIRKRHLEEVRILCQVKPKNGKGFTDKQKQQLIYDEYAHVLPVNRWKLSTPIGKCFNFSNDNLENYVREDLSKEKLAKLNKQIYKDAGKITDFVMTGGDEKHVRELLQQFESKTYK